MSVNNISSTINNPLELIKCSNLTVDKNIKILDENSLPGFTLHYIGDGICRFAPRIVEVELPHDYIELSLPALIMGSTASLEVTAFTDYPLSNFTLPNNTTLEFINPGRYLILVSLTVEAIRDGGLRIKILGDADKFSYTESYLQQLNADIFDIGYSYTSVIECIAGDTINFQVQPSPFNTILELNQLLPDTCKATIIKIN